MLFYHPQYAEYFGTYPKDHLLYRRSKFDPTVPDFDQFPQAKSIGARLTILHPGMNMSKEKRSSAL